MKRFETQVVDLKITTDERDTFLETASCDGVTMRAEVNVEMASGAIMGAWLVSSNPAAIIEAGEVLKQAGVWLRSRQKAAAAAKRA